MERRWISWISRSSMVWWEDGVLVGRVYLEMHPRDGKFSHSHVSTLRLGGGTQPAVALACNLAGGLAGDTGLLHPAEMSWPECPPAACPFRVTGVATFPVAPGR